MILVTGGSGLVGSHLLYFLLKNNDVVRATRREHSNLQRVKKVLSYYTEDAQEYFNRIEWIQADISDLPALTEAFIDIKQVYHCAALISFDPKHFQELRKTNIEGTANVVNLCLHHQVTKLCYVSSIVTLGNTEDNSLITETTEWNPEATDNVYAITKYGAEMEVWRGSQEGLNVVIVHPGVILGEGFPNAGVGTLISMAKKEFPFYMGGGIGVVDVKDVVQSMLLLMESELVKDHFILSAKNVSYKDLMSDLAALIDKKPPHKSIDQWKLMAFSQVDAFISTIFRTKRKLLSATVRSMFTVAYYDGSAIEEAVKFEYTPYSETLKRVVKMIG
jgi:nucleoside-diphosphate-sugar epimerase